MIYMDCLSIHADLKDALDDLAFSCVFHGPRRHLNSRVYLMDSCILLTTHVTLVEA